MASTVDGRTPTDVKNKVFNLGIKGNELATIPIKKVETLDRK